MLLFLREDSEFTIGCINRQDSECFDYLIHQIWRLVYLHATMFHYFKFGWHHLAVTVYVQDGTASGYIDGSLIVVEQQTRVFIMVLAILDTVQILLWANTGMRN